MKGKTENQVTRESGTGYQDNRESGESLVARDLWFVEKNKSDTKRALVENKDLRFAKYRNCREKKIKVQKQQ